MMRPARPEDADALSAVMASAFAPHAARIADLPDVASGTADDIANHRVFVVEEEGQLIAGYTLVNLEDGVKISNLGVHPDHGGQGLGRRLIAHAEAIAKAEGHMEIRLNTHMKMPGNVRLYQRLGWVTTRREGITVSMRKRLR